MQMIPLARTPMDRKSGRHMEKYYKNLTKAFESMTPWLSRSKRRLIEAQQKQKLEPGKLVVKLDANDDPNSPLFKGADIV